MIGTVLLVQGATRARARTITITGATVTDNGDGSVALAISGGGGGGLWTSSGYTGTADRLAGFDGSGAAGLVTISSPLSLSGGALSIDLSAYLTTATAAATYLTIATAASTYQPLDADLTALAGLGNGLPVRSGGTWAANSLGDLAVNAGSMEATQARGLRESGGTTLTMATVADGELLRRVGTTVDGIAATATPTVGAVPIADSSGQLDSWVSGAVKGVRTNVVFVYVLPQAGTNVNLDGSGPTVSTGGILTPSQSEVDYFCTQFGDAGAFYARWYVVGGYRTNQGTIVLNWNFKLGSDTTTSTQHGFMGLSSATTLATANPAGDIGCIRWDVTTANFKLFTKDNTTGTDTDTGVAVTPSYYYMVQMTFTAAAGVPSTVGVKIGRGSTAQAAATDFLTASTTSTSTTMPRSTVDLLAILSLYRLAASTNRSWRFNYFRMTITPSWAT
jgi:hypothetical protein